MLNVLMLNVVMMSVVILNIIGLSVVMLNVIGLSVVIQNVSRHCVVMLSVVALILDIVRAQKVTGWLFVLDDKKVTENVTAQCDQM
jgi:hypothetical protein